MSGLPHMAQPALSAFLRKLSLWRYGAEETFVRRTNENKRLYVRTPRSFQGTYVTGWVAHFRNVGSGAIFVVEVVHA